MTPTKIHRRWTKRPPPPSDGNELRRRRTAAAASSVSVLKKSAVAKSFLFDVLWEQRCNVTVPTQAPLVIKMDTKIAVAGARNAPMSENLETLLGAGYFCGGIIQNYRGRLPYLVSDFTNAVTPKTLSAAIFMFCATTTSTVALGDVAYREMDGWVGITEYFMLQGVASVAHLLFSAYPLPAVVGGVLGEHLSGADRHVRSVAVYHNLYALPA